MRVSTRWRLGLLTAAAIMLLALLLQLYAFRLRGTEWAGSYLSVHPDEAAYLAYVNALIEGRPRRNDPYTGRDDRPGAPQAESLFSIQFIPPYALALPARILGGSAHTAFILLRCVAAFASALAIFWLIALITVDERVAATATLVVLCTGALARAQFLVKLLGGFETPYLHLPFMRSYLPSAAFPFFFLLCAFAWLALQGQKRRLSLISAVAAGLAFALLVYSYFFLWTAAAAWLLCLALLWLLVRPEGWRRDLKSFGVIGALAFAALMPYSVLLSNRAAITDTAQLLVYTRALDLLRPPEVIGALVLSALAYGVRRGLLECRSRAVLFNASLALMPFVVFNQQVLTGRSLQPIHYEQFIANYLAVLAVVLAAWLLWRGRAEAPRLIPGKALVCIALAVYGWGLFEVVLAAKKHSSVNTYRDEVRRVALRLAEEGVWPLKEGRDPYPVVLVMEISQTDYLSIDAPHAVLWSPHMRSFTGIGSIDEDKERFYQYLYYNGIDERSFEEHLRQSRWMSYVVFGWGRGGPGLAANREPITEEEIQAELKRYAHYIANFDRERAAHPTLSYVITSTRREVDFSNLDRWYERDAVERIDRTMLYRVRLR